jgi:hypothetical protein
MAWQIEIPIIVRTLINDLGDQPVYSDERIIQAVTVAAKYVLIDVSLDNAYHIDVSNSTITPDPTDDAVGRDDLFIAFSSLKTACFIDQSTFRTKALTEGIRASLGPANLSVAGSLAGFQTILEKGPCATYEELKNSWNIKDATGISAVLSPFVGNKFNPRYLQTNHYRSRYFYS